MFVLVWLLILLQLSDVVAGYIEIVEVNACSFCRIMLTCRQLDAIIAILEADYPGTSELKEIKEEAVTAAVRFPFLHPRDSLNRRCSGLNHCSFILSEDCPGCEQRINQNLTVKYACVTEDRVKRYCNSEISLSTDEKFIPETPAEGLLLNPGYPRFYAGRKVCRWRISANPEQKIRITVLDIALIEDKPSECTDTLQIIDKLGNVIHSGCTQSHPPQEVVTQSGAVEVRLEAEQILNPRRGVMIKYQVEGCENLEPPPDAYVVSRSEHTVVFGCCLGYVFPDTGTRIKSVECHGTRWNAALPLTNCQKSNLPRRYNQTKDIHIRQDKSESNMSTTEIIAPIILMIAMFILNGGVIFYIFRAKKKQQQIIRDEELGALRR
nr:unnamed protein product [Callosobruchus chinensis]